MYIVCRLQLVNSYFLHWNFDETSYFVVFFHEWNEWKNPQFNSQKLSLERNFSKFYGKVLRWHILVTFPSHLKKLRSILRFWLEKLNCWFFTRFTHEKTPQNNFSRHSVENNYFYTEILTWKVDLLSCLMKCKFWSQFFSVECKCFQILWKSRGHISVTFLSHLKIVMTITSKKIHNSTFRVKISV